MVYKSSGHQLLKGYTVDTYKYPLATAYGHAISEKKRKRPKQNTNTPFHPVTTSSSCTKISICHWYSDIYLPDPTLHNIVKLYLIIGSLQIREFIYSSKNFSLECWSEYLMLCNIKQDKMSDKHCVLVGRAASFHLSRMEAKDKAQCFSAVKCTPSGINPNKENWGFGSKLTLRIWAVKGGVKNLCPKLAEARA